MAGARRGLLIHHEFSLKASDQAEEVRETGPKGGTDGRGADQEWSASFTYIHPNNGTRTECGGVSPLACRGGQVKFPVNREPVQELG